MDKIVCLVRPVVGPAEVLVIPLGLLIIAANLRKQGYKVLIKDYDFIKEMSDSWKDREAFASRAAENIIETGCSYVGFTAMCSNYVLAVEMAKKVKELNRNIHITFGGPHATMCAKETLECYQQVDTVIVGEGEITYTELIKKLETQESLENISGLFYRNDNLDVVANEKRPLLENLDFSLMPAYELIEMHEYLKINNTAGIYVGSGCPYNCNFCTTSLVWERKYRTKTVNRVIKEMEYLFKNYGFTKFDLIHDNLTSNKKFVNSLSRAIKEKKWDINFEFSSRIDTIDQEVIQNVAEAGCKKIFFGIESASTKTQKIMGKNLNLNDVNSVVKHCIENKISPTTAFILGFPHENIEDIETTIRLAFKYRISTGEKVVFNMLSLYTGSRLFNDSYKKMTFDEKILNSDLTIFLGKQHIEEISKYPFIYSTYYFLDYANSPLTAIEYLLLVHFIKITTTNYIYTINALINDLNLSPILVFRMFFNKLLDMSEKERKMFTISKDEVLKIAMLNKLKDNEKEYLVDAYEYDNALNYLDNNNNEKNWILYKGKLDILDNSNTREIYSRIMSADTHYYVIVNFEEEVIIGEIDIIKFKKLERIGKNALAVEYFNSLNTFDREFFQECCDIGMKM